VKLQVTASCAASVIVQRTVVVPTAKAAPDAGAQLIESGCRPPAACGDAKLTRMGPPVNDCETIGAGHETAGRGESPAAVGCDGDAPRTHPIAASAASAAAAAAKRPPVVRGSHAVTSRVSDLNRRRTSWTI